MQTRFDFTLLLMLCFGLPPPATARGASAGSPVIAPVASHAKAVEKQAPVASGYVGADTCVTCHDSEGKSLSHTEHARASRHGGGTAQGD